MERHDLHYLVNLYAKAGEGWSLKALAAALAAFAAWLLPTEALQNTALMTVAMLALDTLTGLLASWHNKVPIQSAKMRRLLVKVAGYSVFLIIIAIVSRSIAGGIKAQEMAVTATLGWIIATEAISILENLAAADVPLPPEVKKWLKERLGAKLKGNG